VTEVDIAGVGAWSTGFSSWEEFGSLLSGGVPSEAVPLKPEVIPATERRRAPLPVKMAVEVMDQACRMAGLHPAEAATVFAGVYGDIQITDYMCRTLADTPHALSPTRFHNSVHNAATGYWAIATKAHGPADAISAYAYSPTMALLEAAVQAVEENTPVVMTVQELATAEPFRPFYDADVPISTALAICPRGFMASKLAAATLKLHRESCEFPPLPDVGGIDWGENYAARILPLMAALDAGADTTIKLPASRHMALSIELSF